MFRLIDIHSHLQDKAYDSDRDDVIARMKEAGGSTIIVGTDRKMSEDAVVLAEKHNLWATVGQHPTDIPDEVFEYDFYKKLTAHPKVVGIGECGLDYFRLQVSGDRDQVVEKQKRLFEEHLRLAVEVNKPLMVHCRPTVGTQDAYNDLLEILKPKTSNLNPTPGNVHFFAGSWATAQKFLNLGFTLSFTGVITFTHGYDGVIKNMPLNMIMVETDAPYVSPVPYRGKRNEPAYVTEVIKRIAEIKGESEENVARVTLENAVRVFGLPALARGE
ncbi:MAG TPA: TatD family hydrolase [Candidatus Paceibacterota bacterium]